MKKMHRDITMRNFGVYVFTATLLLGCAVAKADTVLDWNVIAVNTAIANGQNPFAQARFAAIAQLAVFEAVNSISEDYQPYLGTIQAPAGASVDAAAIQAAYRVLRTYFPNSATTLDMQRANSLAAIARRSSQDRRHRYGRSRRFGDDCSARSRRLIASTIQDSWSAASR